MYKIVKIALVVLGLVGVVLWLMLPDGKMPAAEAAQSGPMGAMFMLTYALMAIAVLFSLFFSLRSQFSNPESLKKSMFILGGFILVMAIAFVLATGSDVNLDEMARRGIDTTEGTVKNIGAGLNVFFILTIIAVGAMLWGGLKKMTSK
ncbi:MAG: hypothetical protein MUO53_12295 [Maribacter sp.]|nr:hypothetical protein [Maribacter sp.]